MDESLQEYKAAALEKTAVLDRAVDATSPELRALIELLHDERTENQERDWETTAEVIESRTGLVRTGAAETVISRVEARYITELTLYAPKQARGPQLTARFRPNGVEVEAVGDDESWVRGQSSHLAERLSGKLPGVLFLRQPAWISTMSGIILLPFVLLMISIADSIRSEFAEALSAPVSIYNPAPIFPASLAPMMDQLLAIACWIVIGVLSVLGFSAVRKALLQLAQRSLPLFQVLSDDTRWRGQSAFSLVGAVLVGVLSGVLGNFVYAALGP